MIVGDGAFEVLCDGRRATVVVTVAAGRALLDQLPAVVRAQPAAFRKGILATILDAVQTDDGYTLTLTAGDVRDIPRLLAQASDVIYTRPPMGPNDRPPAAMWGEPGGEPEAVPLSREQLVGRALGELTDKRERAEAELDQIEASLERLRGLGILAGGRIEALKKKAWKARQELKRFTEGEAA